MTREGLSAHAGEPGRDLLDSTLGIGGIRTRLPME